VRIKDGETATLTVKSKRAELQSIEVEYPISVAERNSYSPVVIIDQKKRRAVEQPRVEG
jgi:CYTH domain-containing protein